MTEDFDKEMDSLLRQAARGETASANSNFQISASRLPHLDADEISAFAENALPEKAKQLHTAHFAACDRCRKILADVILLNAEAISENVHAPEIVKVETIALPWYRRLFAVPNLAYAMGALVLIFGGLIAFTFLKSVSRDTEVSQMNEMPITASNTNSASERVAQTQSNAAMTNSTSMMSNMSISNSAPVSAPNAPTKSGTSNSNAAAASNNQTISENESAKPAARSEQPIASDSAASLPAAPPPAKANPTENQTSSGGATADSNLAARNSKDKEEKRAAEGDEYKTVQSDAPAPPPKPEKSALMSTRSANNTRAKKAQKTDAEKGEMRVIAGKTFKRENGVWYDAAYGGQGTTNITRGSEDFKKLDAGLRSIADVFGGTIVVVWKGKAYRIQ